MTLRRDILILALGIVAMFFALPQYAAAACVNGQEVNENGIVIGTCTTTDPSTDGSGSQDPNAINATISFSDTYAFKRQGVFGCSLQGSHSMSVGALAAVGGVYVPVNDAAVTLNTGYLVYKECVLRGVVNRQREAATAGLAKQGLATFLTGRDGNPFFPQDIEAEMQVERDRVVGVLVNGGFFNALKPELRGPVGRATVQSYLTARNQPNSILDCGYAGDITTVHRGNPDKSVWSALSAIGTPGCDPILAYTLASERLNSVANSSANNLLTQVQMGQGCHPVERIDEYGNRITVSPGSIVCDNITQLLQSGYRQLENSNDIDQMVGSLFSGMIAQVVGDSRGIQGLMQQTGSQPSYLDQVVREANAGLRDAATNAALQILTAAKRVELGYKQLSETILSILAATITDLRSKEAGCWEAIIQKVCAGPLAADKTCTESTACTEGGNCGTGGKLKIATSTAFSTQAVRNSSLGSQASSTEAAVLRANQAVERVDRLIAGITNTTSLEAQRVALQQLDDQVARGLIRNNESQLQADQKVKDDVQATQETFRTNTEQAWKEGNGWCNVNNQATLDVWKNEWRQ